MSTSTFPMQLEQECQDEPDISPDHYRYIQSLDESPACYTRFFDALLIQKSTHSQFLHDLKSFRQQPAIISILQSGTKDAYRECTRAFIASRFAHPWCRTTSDSKAGWTRASWMGTTKKLDAEAHREEDRLHRLLVPLWIAFRRRMFPEPDVLAEWIAREANLKKDRDAEAELRAQNHDETRNGAKSRAPEASLTAYPELGFKTGPTTADASPSPSSKPTSKTSQSGAGAAASQMFLGVAVTGFIMSDKRVRKYVEKKLRK